MAIYEKILKAGTLVGVVKKNGKVEFKSTNYNYQTAEDIDIAVADALREVGLVLIPTEFDVISDVGSIITIVSTYKLVDVETGEFELLQMGGQGQDSGDKRIYKAETGAKKYLFKQLFHIPSEDTDPDKIPSGAWEEPKPCTDGSINWKDYVFKTGKHAGKTLGAVIQTDINWVKWNSTRAGEHQPYCVASLKAVGNG